MNNLTDVKFEQIKLFLTSHNIDIMFIRETFLKPNVSGSVYEIPGYAMYRKGRAGNKKGGGILAYVNSQLKANRLYDLEDENVEIMWLSICPYSSKRAFYQLVPYTVLPHPMWMLIENLKIILKMPI